MKTLHAKQIRRAKQSGFTIIELVVVILLLGILTATALPRFLDVTDEAHVAVQEAVLGGLNTGLALYRAAWFASGQLGANITQFGDGTLDPWDGTTTPAPNGYPVGTDGGDVIADSADCLAIFEGLLQAGRPSATSAVYNATAATLETNIEAVSASNDFVVTSNQVPVSQGTPATVQALGCNFYYTGQFKTGTAAAPVNVPLLQYSVTTGQVTQGTAFTMNQG
ncbi:MAG: type II secretion system protein [Proteobacteria bacterium]|nr:type II secretion system protein [Pseudomonadota bacterium]MDA0926510.1 type II secretion system protein [Pseudomonadota bacterium]